MKARRSFFFTLQNKQQTNKQSKKKTPDKQTYEAITRKWNKQSQFEDASTAAETGRLLILDCADGFLI